jgi:hypothetical protein
MFDEGINTGDHAKMGGGVGNTDAAVDLDGASHDAGDTDGTVEKSEGSVLSVSVGLEHVCVLKRDDSIRCWGNILVRNIGFSLTPVQLNSSGTGRISSAFDLSNSKCRMS